jgi:hypothetical protein
MDNVFSHPLRASLARLIWSSTAACPSSAAPRPALPHLEALLARHRARLVRARILWALAGALVVVTLSG